MKVKLKGAAGRKFGFKTVNIKCHSGKMLLNGLKFHFGEEIETYLAENEFYFTGVKDGVKVSLDTDAVISDKLDLDELIIRPVIHAEFSFKKFFKVVIGIVLIVVSFYIPATWGYTAQFVFSLGASLILNVALSYLMKTSQFRDEEKDKNVFGYLPNITMFGTPFPIVLGSNVRCGSIIIASDYTSRFQG